MIENRRPETNDVERALFVGGAVAVSTNFDQLLTKLIPAGGGKPSYALHLQTVDESGLFLVS